MIGTFLTSLKENKNDAQTTMKWTAYFFTNMDAGSLEANLCCY